MTRNSVYFLTTVVKKPLLQQSICEINPVCTACGYNRSVQSRSRLDSVLQDSPEVDPFHVWLDLVRYCGQVPEGAVHLTWNVADARMGTVSAHWSRGGHEKQQPEQPPLQVRGAGGAHAHCAQDRGFHTLSRTMEPPGDAGITSFNSHGINKTKRKLPQKLRCAVGLKGHSGAASRSRARARTVAKIKLKSD